MALYQTEAVVLGSKNWGEADKVMTLFTRERGLVRAAAFGKNKNTSETEKNLSFSPDGLVRYGQDLQAYLRRHRMGGRGDHGFPC